MTTQTQNTQAQYFNLHTKGVGYINRFREVKTQAGKFCSVTVGFLRGSADNVQYTYVDCIIRNAEICEVLKAKQDVINGDNKVLAVVTVGDIYAETFEHNGKTLAGMKGRLIGMTQLKVDGQIVWHKAESESDEHNEANFQDDQAGEPVANQEAASEPQAEMPVEDNDADAELPTAVKLDPNAPDFQTRKEELKAQGYRWNNDVKAWTLSAA
jgi:hypothetical protein